MSNRFARFLLHWLVTSLSLWVASEVFTGIHFSSTSALVISALLLGFVNAIIRPLLVILTLPLTVLTLGVFLLVINALMLMLVSGLVTGFMISSFTTAFLASILISITSYLIGAVLGAGTNPR